jgi:hypothetical protein
VVTNYRSLFDDLRIEWVDRGANTSHGHINIACPWCGDDPSHHLAINEESGGYFCYRSHAQHAGYSVWKLLMQLKVPRAEMERVVKRYGQGTAPPPREMVVERPGPTLHWEAFPPASASAEALDYLAGRGYTEPEKVARLAGLRVCEEGKLARRLLLPISDGKHIIGYTARAMQARMRPKYLTSPAVAGGVYVPVEPLTELRPLFLLEGPFDALKLWAASGQHCAALLGLALPWARLNRLRPLLLRANVAYLVLDGDQDKFTKLTMANTLNRAIQQTRVYYADGPTGYKDMGDTPLGEIVEWLNKMYLQVFPVPGTM